MNSDDWVKVIVGAIAGTALKSLFDWLWPRLFDRAGWRRRMLPWATKEARSLAYDAVVIAAGLAMLAYVLTPFDQPVTGLQLAKVVGLVLYVILMTAISVGDLIQFLIKRGKVLADFDATAAVQAPAVQAPPAPPT